MSDWDPNELVEPVGGFETAAGPISERMERVAEAIWGWTGPCGHDNWSDLSEATRRHYRVAADQAIAAYRLAAGLGELFIIAGTNGPNQPKLEADWDGAVHTSYRDAEIELLACRRNGYDDYHVYRMTRADS